MATVIQLKEALAKELARIEKKSVVSRAGDDRPSYDRVLKILQQLDKLPVDLTILQDTFVGIIVSKLKTIPDDVVAKTARRLLKKWKRAIKEEETASAAAPARAPARGENNTIRRKQPPPPPPPQKQHTLEKHHGISKSAAFKSTRCVNVKVAQIRPQYKNLADWIADSEGNVYIGRRGVIFVDGKRFPLHDSIWCSPFKLRGSTREKVLEEYERYIRDKLATDATLRERLVKELKGKRLGCWCKPEACHGDILIQLVEEHLSDGVFSEQEVPNGLTRDT